MMVILKPGLFEDPRLVDLIPFLWLGLTPPGRHRIVVEDDKANAYRAWLHHLDAEIRDEWLKMISIGWTLAERHPSFHEIEVDAITASRWSDPTPTLTLEDALDLLHRSYRILLENGYSDRSFFMSLCSLDQIEFLQKRLAMDWVEFEHCGGNHHIERRAKEIRKHRRLYLRFSALFDGDGLEPRVPSKRSQSVKIACGSDVHHHQLLRRSIENYLPKSALERWAMQKTGNQKKKRERIVRALFKLTSEQRAHYNMKDGFNQDEKRPGAGKLFDGARRPEADVRRTLADGLGYDIATLYEHGGISHDEFENDHSVRELKQFIADVIERIR